MPRAGILREVTFAHAQNTTLAMVLFAKVQYIMLSLNLLSFDQIWLIRRVAACAGVHEFGQRIAIFV
jgi:hypothetical protein